MTVSSRLKLGNIIRIVSLSLLTILAVLVVAFALVSGSEDYGGGIEGVIQNSPNALPWLTLLALVILAWKKELLGGIMITLLGIGLAIFFNTGSNFFLSTFILTLLIPLLGIALLVSYAMRNSS